MTYTEKELDQFLHGISLSLLSKKSAQHWRYDEETAKEIEWLEVLERKVRADKADRKTEPTHDLRTETHECVKDTHDKTSPNCSEKPNNCTEPQIFICPIQDDYEALIEDEPQTETKTETQNSNLTFEKRTMRDCYNCKRYETEGECIECHYEPKDEPQTEEHCETCRHKDKCEGATYEYKNTEWWCLAYAPIKDEPQTDCSWK